MSHDNIRLRARASFRKKQKRWGINGVSEFEESWQQVLSEAKRRAEQHGRGEVVDFLQLRAANDALRAAGIEWLITIFQRLADEAAHAGRALTIEREETHRFSVGAATMIGTVFRLRRGVRQLTIEAGWPRAPQHGFVRGNGLARARIKHFGDVAAGAELILSRAENNIPPQWFLLQQTGERAAFSEAHARQHVEQFLEG